MTVAKTPARWTPGKLSAPEAFVIRHAAQLELLRRMRDRLAGVQLAGLEGHILVRHVWQQLPLSRLAEFLDVTERELADARERMIAEVAEAVGDAAAWFEEWGDVDEES